MEKAYDADPSSPRLNEPLRRARRCARCHAVSLLREEVGPIVGRHLGADVHARTEVVRHGDRLPVALLDLSGHEPGRNTRAGGEGLPHFLRRAGDFEFDLNGTATVGFFLHAHCSSLGLTFCGSGCATTTRRCARPPGADSSSYLETSFVMASARSSVNAARSAGDRKRTSVSTARVARRLPVFFARRTRSATSRTIRAPRAMR